MSELQRARSILDADELPSLDSAAHALQIIADASANLELRPQIQDDGLFERLLILFSGFAGGAEEMVSNASLWRNLLRCIGNLIADNDTRRSGLVANSTYLNTLNLLLTSDSTSPEATTLAHTAIKVLFNLCTDNVPAQQECFKKHIHQSLIYCLDTRPPTDQGVWSLALDLTCMIVEHKRELEPSEDYPDFERNAPRLLRLPLRDFDAPAFLDALTVVAAHLLDKNFVQAVVEYKQIDLVWNLLQHTERRARSDREVDDEEDYDEKQYLQFQLVFSQGLADMTALPLYNEKYDSSDNFIQSIIPQTIPTSTDPQSRSPIPPAACLILGNLITSDEAAVSLAPQVPIQELIFHLGRSNDTAFLNAASGLLRHLATPMQNREDYFSNPEYLRYTQHLYTDISLEQVQMGGLALTRQILANMKPRLIQALSDQNNNILSTLLSTYQTTTSTPVKLEMSRMSVSFFRTLQASSPSNDAEDKKALETLFENPANLPSILDPIIFTIKHAAEPNIIAIQAEAWLGLNLGARLPFGAAKIADAFEDEEMFALYCSRLGDVSEDGGKQEDSRPQWLREKERDNAVLLCAELIKSEGVDERIKEKFRGALRERDIRVG